MSAEDKAASSTSQSLTQDNAVKNLTFLKDFPPGPLDAYRKDASFNWKEMALFLEGEDILRFKVKFSKYCRPILEINKLQH